jgi:hypothetical protein
MNPIRTIVLLGVLTGGLIALGGALGPLYLSGFTALSLILNLGSYFFSDGIDLTPTASKVFQEAL